jgi:hypothetical protein
MIVIWLAAGLLAGGAEPVAPAVESPPFAVWRNRQNAERKRREQLESEARRKLEEAIPEIPFEDRDEVRDRLSALLRQFTFAPLPEVGPEVGEVADRAVSMLIAEAEAEFDRYVLGLMKDRDERDAITAILFCL